MISSEYLKQWEAAQPRIDEGIETNRKSDLALKLVDQAGRPIAGRRVTIEQTASEFLFGANLFMIDAYQGAAARRFEEAYVGLFNAGTVALYWRDLEPAPGQLRFAKDSPFIRRRPPVDLAVDFGRRHGLNLSGHPLVWDFIKWSVPDWLSDADSIAGAAWEKRVEQIGERYGQAIPRWDVVNEAVLTPRRLKERLSRPMPDNYVRKAFGWAEKHLPASAHLMINETAGCWWSDREPYYEMIRGLIADGARVDGIGLQIHLFAEAEMQKVAAGSTYTPQQLLDVLDRFAEFRRPLHISEITLTSPRGQADGPELQAIAAKNCYRLWFSHPAVHAITWWNVPDGGAAPGEDGVDSGLLDPNLNPKPAYLALQKLIRDEWRTRLSASTDANGVVRFRGFHGQYAATVDGGKATFTLTRQGGSVEVRV